MGYRPVVRQLAPRAVTEGPRMRGRRAEKAAATGRCASSDPAAARSDGRHSGRPCADVDVRVRRRGLRAVK